MLVLPWIIAGPHDFWHDAVDANTGLGYRADALCIATWVHKEFGHDPGFALTALGLLIAYAIAWRVRGDAFGFCAGAGLLVLALDITNTQSFFNHYTLGMALVVLALCVRRRAVAASRTASALGGEPDELRRLEQPAPVDLSHRVAPERRELVGDLGAVVAERAVAVGADQVDRPVGAGQLVELAGEGGGAGAPPSAWRSRPSRPAPGPAGVGERDLLDAGDLVAAPASDAPPGPSWSGQ